MKTHIALVRQKVRTKLFGDFDSMSERITLVELRNIQPNRLNPRLDINIEKLNELADSIRNIGLVQPLIVRPIGDHYEVVVGERRYRACQQVGLEKVPVIIQDYSDDQVVELNLVENIQREDLSAVEKGKCCKLLMEKYPDKYPTIKDLGKKLAVSDTSIEKWLQLVSAPTEIQRMVAPAEKIGVPRPKGKIDYDTAATIVRRIKEPERQVEVAREIAKRPIYRRTAREVIKAAAKEPEKPIERVVKEIIEAPYELPFRLRHMEPIMSNIKTQTTRKGIPNPKVKVGALVHASVWEPHFTDLRITSIERKRLGEITEEDAKREGGYTLKEFQEVWKSIHGEWNDEDFVYVIHFERVK